MLSRITFAVVCCICIAHVSGVTDAIRQIVCVDSLCSRCLSPSNNMWCKICNCGRRSRDVCSDVRCYADQVCTVKTAKGWFRTTYAECVPKSTTVTTTPTTTSTTTISSTRRPERVCKNLLECELNEVCIVPIGETFGACQVVGQRSINPKCFEEKRIGPCRAGFQKYFYNTTTAKCQGFFYGGCQPSDNNFDTMEECQAECEADVATLKAEPQDPACQLPMHTGDCRALMTYYFFNSETQKCQEFRYGGCGGNANKWETKEECSEKCERPTQRR